MNCGEYIAKHLSVHADGELTPEEECAVAERLGSGADDGCAACPRARRLMSWRYRGPGGRERSNPALKLMIDAAHRYDGYIVQSTGESLKTSPRSRKLNANRRAG